MSRSGTSSRRPDAGVADEEVETAERLRRALDEPLRAVHRRDVARVRDCLHAVMRAE